MSVVTVLVSTYLHAVFSDLSLTVFPLLLISYWLQLQ